MSSMVSSPEILRSCRQNSALKAAEKMIDLAKGRGGPDNITVQVIRII
jgi:serine/threonine protein phosphatase PrpC